MLVFIWMKLSRALNRQIVSIHPMLVFIKGGWMAKRKENISFNTSHVGIYLGWLIVPVGLHTVSIHPMLVFILLGKSKYVIHRMFQYIPCWYLSNEFKAFPFLPFLVYPCIIYYFPFFYQPFLNFFIFL